MKVLISENQYKSIILESPRKQINFDLNRLKNFTEEVIGKFQEDTGIQFKLLFTWGAAVGGILLPLNNFIETGGFELNSFQATSILVATAAILFGENSRLIKQIISKIKEDGIEEIFDIILEKGNQLKQTFLDFIESLNVTMYTMTNIMSYAFLIPILPIIWEISNNGGDVTDAKDITIRLLSFGLTSVTGAFLKTLISKIIERFR
jgi:hypothetical protein